MNCALTVMIAGFSVACAKKKAIAAPADVTIGFLGNTPTAGVTLDRFKQTRGEWSAGPIISCQPGRSFAAVVVIAEAPAIALTCGS